MNEKRKTASYYQIAKEKRKIFGQVKRDIVFHGQEESCM